MSADNKKPSLWRGPRSARGWHDLARSWGRGSWGLAGKGNGPHRTHALPRLAPEVLPEVLPELAPELAPEAPQSAVPARAAACWSPADGNAEFVGQPGQDVLALRDVSLTQLVIAINVLEPGLSLHLDADGGLGFVDQSGEPQPFSGDLTIHGARLRFTATLCITLA